MTSRGLIDCPTSCAIHAFGTATITDTRTGATRTITTGAGTVTTFFDDVVHNGAEIFTVDLGSFTLP